MKNKIFGLTYAGGSADFYNELGAGLEKEGIELVALEYSGHGLRRKEPYYNDFGQLAEDMIDLIMQNLSDNDQYVLLGYSMGSIAVVEILKGLIARNKPLPKSVILAAHEPKAKSELKGWNNDISDECIKERIFEFGGIPENLNSNAVFWRVYLPVYRDDFRMIGEYRFDQIGLDTDIPALVMYSQTDTPIDEMEKWNNYFTGKVVYKEYRGNHFFINDHIAEITEQIVEWVKEESK